MSAKLFLLDVVGEEGAELGRVPGKKRDMWNLEKENGDERPETDRGIVGLRKVMVVDDAEVTWQVV